jgi:hypothetical protein
MPTQPQESLSPAESGGLDGWTVYLTDARKVGIMLRDRRLTLRNHSAITEFILESTSHSGCVLRAPAMDNNGYVRIGDRNGLSASASRDKAQHFELKLSDMGLELFIEDRRPAVFDFFYDVSIGKWQNGRSLIPILVHTFIPSIWGPDPASKAGDGSKQGNTP